MAANTAAVSYAALHADFVNNGSQISLTTGAVVSAAGTLSTIANQPSFVELADTGVITISGTKTPFFVIAGFSWNGSSTQEFQTGNGSISLSLTNGNFTISDNDPMGTPSIAANASISVDSQLTLVADPGSTIGLSGFSGTLPIIGSFAGGTVPEPSAWIQLGTAMALLGALWCRRRYLRISLTSSRMPGVSLVLLVGLTSLIVGLGAPGRAGAGTITINNLSVPLSTSSSGFSSSSASTDSLLQQVTFNGNSLSQDPLQPGQSVTYNVVFQEPSPNGSGLVDSASTVLSIASLVNPTPTQNTSVSVLFQGILIGPINPAPGVYYVTPPGGFFDVAAYLRGQQSPEVPTDLSVLVATVSVPEPPSLLVGGVAALISLAFALCRTRARAKLQIVDYEGSGI